MITERNLRRWIRDVRAGRRSPKALLEVLKRLPFEQVGTARLDTHRHLRRGLPEVIFCEGKSSEQLISITRRLIEERELVLLSRLDAGLFQQIAHVLPQLHYEPLARLAYYHPSYRKNTKRGLILVVSGGSADLPVAEEAFLTLQLLGSRAMRLYDVGVAGLHRLLSQWSLLRRARVIIVIAGMEGALASVVAGLIAVPVIAVPTSVGYGASFEGIAPLLTMLNSCVPGIGVVNIDNGFGAAYLAHIINHPPWQHQSRS